MNALHWEMLGFTGAAAALLLYVSLSCNPNTRLYRWARRVFWAGALLALSGALGGVGLNALTLPVTVLLNVPGYITLTALSLL